MKLEISLFKFDKNSDYLPYYTKHFIKITNENNLLDILNNINNENRFDYINDGDFDLVINGVYAKASITIEQLTKNFGRDITIEPISIRRACHDLLIDEKDFKEKIELLKDFIDEDDKLYYNRLKQYYYASNTLNYEDEYIGDAILILASDIIEKRPDIKELVLKQLHSAEVGAQYHTSLKNRIFNFDYSIEEKIEKMQEDLGYIDSSENQNFRVDNTLKIDFGTFNKDYEVKHDFKDFNIVYYDYNKCEDTQTLLSKLDAKILNLDTTKLDLAKRTFNKNKKITFKTACTILLDAFDNNADFIVVDNDDDFYIFDYNRKSLEKLCGRDVLIPVIHKNELQKLVSGEHNIAKRTLDKHQVNPEII
ncbi:hypothetical protein GCM10012288_17020 [Malaciobacter pacificus]|uniref:DUF5644 domain-containing protein n=1 Tax=Malaciobacter pacificus TaxID=1080223 RepID=A0A5C2H7I4_9BACT|nr:DUF5644 domain-containing protein [Malaciobacter pacificus]QEP34921.1 hypothetical protein APAC_1842 [Malaciobacter pacificus]GGD43326.1 hypothetical protein GCM10012288_17020 [Malaciobacter pacificus]